MYTNSGTTASYSKLFVCAASSIKFYGSR